MDAKSHRVRTFLAFLSILAIIFIGYVYLSNKSFNNSHRVNVATVATSSAVVVDEISKTDLMFISNAKIVETQLLDLDGPWGSHKMYVLTFTTGQTKEVLVSAYKDTLLKQHYIIDKQKATDDRTEILATNQTSNSNVTIDIRSINRLETVTILLEKH